LDLLYKKKKRAELKLRIGGKKNRYKSRTLSAGPELKDKRIPFRLNETRRRRKKK
jgi:hypothetical protein